jgi:hypothetical protein
MSAAAVAAARGVSLAAYGRQTACLVVGVLVSLHVKPVALDIAGCLMSLHSRVGSCKVL